MCFYSALIPDFSNFLKRQAKLLEEKKSKNHYQKYLIKIITTKLIIIWNKLSILF